MGTDYDTMISTDAAAGLLQVCRRRVVQLVKAGILGGRKIGRTIVVDSRTIPTAKRRNTKRGRPTKPAPS